MRDRVSNKPGRYKFTFEDSSLGEKYAVAELADEPTVVGTPLNKTTLLREGIADLANMSEEATPSDIFEYILNQIVQSDRMLLWGSTTPPVDSTAVLYSGNVANAPTYRKWGPVVNVRGIVSPASTGQTSVTIGTLPSGFRPTRAFYTVVQCSYNKRASLYVSTSGVITVNRVDDHTKAQNTTSNTFSATEWIPFDITFMLD